MHVNKSVTAVMLGDCTLAPPLSGCLLSSKESYPVAENNDVSELNLKGNINSIKTEEFDSLGVMQVVNECTCRYDDKGNWILKNIFRKNRDPEHEKRTIYYRNE